MEKTSRLVLHGSRWKMPVYLLVAIGFVVVGGWLLSDPSLGGRRYSPDTVLIVGWACVIFFGLGVVVFAASIIWPSRLFLTPEGFTQKQVWSSFHVRWRDVRDIFLWRAAGRGGVMVAWTLHDHARPSSLMAKVSHVIGADGTLGAGWPQSPQSMVDLLKEWKARYAPEPPNDPEP